MPEIGLVIEDLGEYDRKLAQLASFILDLRPFWPLVVPIFIGWMREQFESEGGWGGDPWAPLTEASLASKESKWGSAKSILIASGDLRKAASNPRRIPTPESLTLEIDDSGMSHGGSITRSVIQYHQEGTDKMPARPIIPAVLPATAQKELQEAAAAYIDEMAVRLGLTV